MFCIFSIHFVCFLEFDENFLHFLDCPFFCRCRCRPLRLMCVCERRVTQCSTLPQPQPSRPRTARLIRPPMLLPSHRFLIFFLFFHLLLSLFVVSICHYFQIYGCGYSILVTVSPYAAVLLVRPFQSPITSTCLSVGLLFRRVFFAVLALLFIEATIYPLPSFVLMHDSLSICCHPPHRELRLIASKHQRYSPPSPSFVLFIFHCFPLQHSTLQVSFSHLVFLEYYVFGRVFF